MTRIAVVSAGLSNPSSTRLLADRLAERTAAILREAGTGTGTEIGTRTGSPTGTDTGTGTDSRTDTAIDQIELRELAHPLADHLLTGFATGALAAAIDTVTAADALIVVTPVFAASYSGLFKSFFDVLDPDALRGKPVLPAATAGTARHSLVLEHALRPLLAHFGALTVPTAVFAAAEDWGTAGIGGAGLDDRIDRGATELAALLSGHTRTTGPRRWGSEAGFSSPVEFTELIRRAST